MRPSPSGTCGSEGDVGGHVGRRACRRAIGATFTDYGQFTTPQQIQLPVAAAGASPSTARSGVQESSRGDVTAVRMAAAAQPRVTLHRWLGTTPLTPLAHRLQHTWDNCRLQAYGNDTSPSSRYTIHHPGSSINTYALGTRYPMPTSTYSSCSCIETSSRDM